MGYTHGRRWSHELIKEETLKVIHELGLDRMPTQKEIRNYTGNYGLSCAISKRNGGFYTLAKELNMNMKKSDTQTGKNCEALAMKIIESYGFSVKRMTTKHPFDLLVNDKVRIDVKASHLYRGPNGNFYTFSTNKKYATCDVYFLMTLGEEDEVKNFYVVPSAKIFGNNQISIGEFTSKYEIFKNEIKPIRDYLEFLTRESA